MNDFLFLIMTNSMLDFKSQYTLPNCAQKVCMFSIVTLMSYLPFSGSWEKTDISWFYICIHVLKKFKIHELLSFVHCFEKVSKEWFALSSDFVYIYGTISALIVEWRRDHKEGEVI